MAMEVKRCLACSRRCWHNSMKGADGKPGSGWRCTFCGFPITTKVEDKKAFQTWVHKHQVAKVRLV